MRLLSDSSFLGGLGELLVALALVGQASLFFFPAGRRLLERSLAVLFTVVAIGAVLLIWQADALRAADRDLTPAQQAALSQAISQFPAARYEVLTSRPDREARSLAVKIAAAVRAGSGAMPQFDDTMPLPPNGVVLVLRSKDDEASRKLIDTLGRVLMAARIAVISDRDGDMADDTVRIVVGGKP